MDLVVGIILAIGIVAISYMLGEGRANGRMLTIKRENERLNKELLKLTERDSKGRFTGGK